jgi:hypothetical protein
VQNVWTVACRGDCHLALLSLVGGDTATIPNCG